jgi:hypothetical protein
MADGVTTERRRQMSLKTPKPDGREFKLRDLQLRRQATLAYAKAIAAEWQHSTGTASHQRSKPPSPLARARPRWSTSFLLAFRSGPTWIHRRLGSAEGPSANRPDVSENTISTRRFCCRPAGVSFDATG